MNIVTIGQNICYLQDYKVKIKEKGLKKEKIIQPPHLKNGKLQYIYVYLFWGLYTVELYFLGVVGENTALNKQRKAAETKTKS